MKTRLIIDGIHCSGCKGLIEDICSDFTEITLARLDVKTHELSLEHAPGLDLAKLIEEIESAGSYKVKK